MVPVDRSGNPGPGGWGAILVARRPGAAPGEEVAPGAEELVALVSPLLLDPLRATVNQRTLVSSVSAAEIQTSELGPQSVAVGAATMILKAALDDSDRFPDVSQDNGHSSRSIGA